MPDHVHCFVNVPSAISVSRALQILKGGSVGVCFILAIIFYILFVVIVVEIYARMFYNRYLYEIAKDAVKIIFLFLCSKKQVRSRRN